MSARPDLILADFEGDAWGDWKAEGSAFGSGPARGALPGQPDVEGYRGRGFANSFHGGDPAIGRLISPEFRVERRYLTFMIGGGLHTFGGTSDPGYVGVNLVHRGRIVRSSPRPIWAPGGSEVLSMDWFDLADLQGQQVHIEIIDLHTGPWGHVLADHFLQSDDRPGTDPSFAVRRFLVDRKFLVFPARADAPYREFQLALDGRVVVSNTVCLSAGQPDFRVPVDVTPWRGEELSLLVEELPGSAAADLLEAVRLEDSPAGCEELYREPHRPLIHYTPRRGACSDANGLVWHRGEWHLGYQHVPFNVAPPGENCNWGWGHAVSRDLVHWEELPDILWPDELGIAESGSCVVDHRDTSGLRKGDEPAMVVFYPAGGGRTRLSHGRATTICLAYSIDRGRTWRKYAGNPVIPNIDRENRDPKVFWYAPGCHWVMVLYIHNGVYFVLTSKDLLRWEFQSQACGTHECPDLFELPVDGDPSRTKWVFFGATCDYLVGSFDGKRFTAETDVIRFKHTDGSFYAAQTFNDSPDGRRILIAKGGVYGHAPAFSGLMTFPIELTLRTTDEGIRLYKEPVREVGRLRTGTVRTAAGTRVEDGSPLRPAVTGRLLDIEAEFTPAGARELVIDLFSREVILDLASRELRFFEAQERHWVNAPIALVEGRLKLRMLVDTVFLEIYSADGRYYTPVRCTFPVEGGTLEVRASGGAVVVERLEVHEIESIWKGRAGS